MKRSPTIEIATQIIAKTVKPSRRFPAQPNQLPAARANSAPPIRPPIAPSQVLPGLTRGASLLRPRLLPEKYAVLSATHISTTKNNTHHGPRQPTPRKRLRPGQIVTRNRPASTTLLHRPP